MEPTAEEMKAMTTIDAALAWTGLATEAGAALKAAIGASGDEHPRVTPASAEPAMPRWLCRIAERGQRAALPSRFWSAPPTAAQAKVIAQAPPTRAPPNRSP